MRKPGVSIAMLGVAVAVIAADCAWLRYLLAGSQSLLGFRGPALDAGVMPMASVVAVGVAHLRLNRGRASRTLAGFVAGGALGVSLYLVYGWIYDLVPSALASATMSPIYLARGRWPILDFTNYLYYADAVYYTAFQVPFALIGAWLGRRHRPSKAEAITPEGA